MSRFTFLTQSVFLWVSPCLCVLGVCFYLFMSHSSCHQCHSFSMVPSCDYIEDCFICGQFCNITGDHKHLSCWERNPGVLCRPANREKDKEDQEKVLRMSSWKFATNEMIFLVIQWWSARKQLLLIYVLRMEGTNLFSLKHRPLSAAKSCHRMILTANSMHSHKFACFPCEPSNCYIFA